MTICAWLLLMIATDFVIAILQKALGFVKSSDLQVIDIQRKLVPEDAIAVTNGTYLLVVEVM